MTLLLLVVAVVLAVWAGLVAATAITWGTFGVLLAFAVAAFAGSFLPWKAWDARLRQPGQLHGG